MLQMEAEKKIQKEIEENKNEIEKEKIFIWKKQKKERKNQFKEIEKNDSINVKLININ